MEPRNKHGAAESFCDFFFLSPKKTIINSIDSRAPRASSIKVAGGWEWAALGGRWKRLSLWVVTGF